MRWWIRTTLGAMAFLLFAATVGAGVRSYFTSDDISMSAPSYPAGEHYYGYGLNLWRGRLVLFLVRHATGYESPVRPSAVWDSEPTSGWRHTGGEFNEGGTWLGFGAKSFDLGWWGTPGRQWDVQIPLWAPATLWAVPAALWLRGVWRRTRAGRRDRLGLCPACGYDLRASADRCPECGRPITPPPAVAPSSWGRELRPLALALALLLAIGAVTEQRVHAYWENRRFAWSEHYRLKAVREAAEQAVEFGDAEALEAALGAAPILTPAEVTQGMLRAIRAGRADVAGVLLAHGADVTVDNGHALGDAIGRGMTDLALRLLDHGADPRAKSGSDYFPASLPLHLAVEECHTNADLELPRRLLARGADPNARNEVGMTALQWLAANAKWQENSVAFAQLLLAHGADVNARNDQGVTPLTTALIKSEVHGRMDLVNFLRSHGAKE